MMRPAILAAGCCLGLIAGQAAAQGDRPANPPAGSGATVPSLGGRQFPSGQVEREVRSTDDPAAAEHDRRQLQELNDLTRQLAPPGTPVPAPGVEQNNRRR